MRSFSLSRTLSNTVLVSNSRTLKSSVKNVVKKIKQQTEKINDKNSEEKLQVFLDFFIFSLQTSKSEKAILKLFPIHSTDFVMLFLLRFKLYLKYEGSVLLMSILHFKILQVLLSTCIQRYSRLDLVNEESLPLFSLVFSIASKVFIRDETLLSSVVPAVFSFDLIQMNLLFNLRDSTVFSAPNFWQGFFDWKFKKTFASPNSQSQKLRVLKIAEIMMFYHYFFSTDFEVTTRFVDNCLLKYNTNLKLLQNPVKFKVGETLYYIIDFYNQKHSTQRSVMSNREKLTKVLGLILTRNLLETHDFINAIYIDRYIANSLLKCILKTVLSQKTLLNDQRRLYWLKFIQLNEIYEPKLNLTQIRQLPVQMLEQIQIDVARTRQWRGKTYTQKIQKLIVDFFEQKSDKFEYFQGFNFIVSFLFEIFEDESEFALVANHIGRTMLLVNLSGFFRRQTLRQINRALFCNQPVAR